MEKDEILACDFFTEDECKDIILYLEDKKKYLVEKYGKNMDPSEIYYSESQTTTSYFYRYNFFLDNPHYIERISYYINNILPFLEFPIGIQCWGNIYENGMGINLHNHSGLKNHSFSANIFLGGPTKPGITYVGDNKRTIENKIGQLQIFNCDLMHMVSPNISKEKRYTLGMTIHSYQAITPNLLSGACTNAKWNNFILLTK